METENLKTVQNFSREYGYSTVYIYRLIKKTLLKSVVIDGVIFVDTTSVPTDFKKK
jgi:hypothetical protein